MSTTHRIEFTWRGTRLADVTATPSAPPVPRKGDKVRLGGTDLRVLDVVWEYLHGGATIVHVTLEV